MFAITRTNLTRRAFIGRIAAAGAAAGAVCVMPERMWYARLLAIDSGRQPVISFHMDQPYLDITGAALPYLPPNGARSGEPAAHFDEATFRGMLI
jgi:hypothetical protein